MWGINEDAEGPDLYRYLVGELDKLGLAYVHVMHQGNEELLADIRKLWKRTLIVTSGLGWVQTDSGPRQEIRAGDIIWIPPGEKHWHGATATTAMSHIAISEALDGKTVDWMEKVTDVQFNR